MRWARVVLAQDGPRGQAQIYALAVKCAEAAELSLLGERYRETHTHEDAEREFLRRRTIVEDVATELSGDLKWTFDRALEYAAQVLREKLDGAKWDPTTAQKHNTWRGVWNGCA